MLSYANINAENGFLAAQVIKIKNKKLVKFQIILLDWFIKNKALKRLKFLVNFRTKFI